MSDKRDDQLTRLIGYAEHDSNCARMTENRECTCGLSDLIREVQAEDERRAAACLRACEGIPTEALESETLLESVRAIVEKSAAQGLRLVRIQAEIDRLTYGVPRTAAPKYRWESFHDYAQGARRFFAGEFVWAAARELAPGAEGEKL